uniref:Uncharacterized protein n=1 Tax=Rhizophora mucronata TaxID=61149 RepID=A0A2P2Q1M2_RHIMU
MNYELNSCCLIYPQNFSSNLKKKKCP